MIRSLLLGVFVLAVLGCDGSAPTGAPATAAVAAPTPSAAPVAELPTLTLQGTIGDLGATALVLATSDAVWVLDHSPAAIHRIDPSTNKVTATINLGGFANGLGLAGGRIWTFNQSNGTMVGVDPVTAKVVARITAGQDGDVFWVGDEAAWITTAGKVVRIDGATEKPSTLPLDGSCSAASAAAGGGFVWLASESGAVCKVDETTGAVVARGTAAGSGAGLAIVAGSPWLVSADGGLVVLDPAALSVATTVAPPAPGRFQGSTYSIGRPGGESTVVVGNIGGATGWVRYTGATIGHVTLTSTPRITLFAGLPANTLAGGVVEAFGSLWVANFGARSVERYALPTS